MAGFPPLGDLARPELAGKTHCLRMRLLTPRDWSAKAVPAREDLVAELRQGAKLTRLPQSLGASFADERRASDG